MGEDRLHSHENVRNFKWRNAFLQFLHHLLFLSLSFSLSSFISFSEFTLPTRQVSSHKVFADCSGRRLCEFFSRIPTGMLSFCVQQMVALARAREHLQHEADSESSKKDSVSVKLY